MSEPRDERELRDLVALTLIPGIGPLTLGALLERFKTPGRILSASIESLRGVEGVGPKLAAKIAEARRGDEAEVELAHCRQDGVDLIARSNPDYPEPLSRIADPPSLLYRRGTTAPSDGLAIAIVGSRKCTPYGIRMAERLAQSLARVGLTVVSGLARGIDGAAHRGALKAGGRTVAVLANGLSAIYPPEHSELADEVAASGAIYTESPMRQGPLAGLFPQRNRIISGLCLGVVVVEATPRSGSLSTAKHAMEQDREVFAVPGPADSLSSRGCHALIRDGARLVETVDDILEELGPLVKEVKAADEGTPVRHPVELALNERERSILGHLGDDPLGVDDLVGAARLTASQVMATLSILEMRRLIRRMPGNRFVRI